MTANPWLLSFHLIALFVWLGQLLYLSRFLGYHVQEAPEVQQRMSVMQKRMYLFIDLPGMILVLVTGLMMLHGVAYSGFADPGEALRFYLVPRTDSNLPSAWYVTFHVKLVSFVLLALTDAYIGTQIFRMAKGVEPKHTWALGVILALIGSLIPFVAAWLILAELGVPHSREISYVFVFAGLIGGFVGGRKLARKDNRAKYSILHGVIAALLMLVVILVVAKPLQFGGSTLG